jgi:hypothetical protein
MSESDSTTQGDARVLLLPATLRRGVRPSAGATYYPRLCLARAAWQGGDALRADRFRGWLYTSWAAGVAARRQQRFGPGARPGFIFALRPSGTIERWMQSPQVHLHRHTHTSLISTQFNLRAASPSAPTVERHPRTMMLERTLVTHNHTPADAPVGASGRATALSSVVALIEQRYGRVSMPEASEQARETTRRNVSPPPTDFVFRRESQVSEPGRAPTRGHEPPLPRSQPAEPRRSPDGARPATAAAAAPRLDVDVLTEQVMQRMQRRLTAQRERMGRV